MRAGVDNLETLRRRNDVLHAFTEISLAEGEPSEDPAETVPATLRGTSFAVKDIIDVAGLATRNGSKVCSDAPPADLEAPVVSALRRAGACCVGKTTTTEFAFTDPTDCRNPHDLGRSPGGSSSGSGAAVGAGMIDFALGTQTAGSLCRPAAYCGAVGFKPSYGVLPTRGVTPLAPSFDTVGIIAKSVAMAERAFRAMVPAAAVVKAPRNCTLGTLLFDQTARPAQETKAAYRGAITTLAQICGPADRLAPDLDIAKVVADHRVVMTWEAHAAHGHLLQQADLLRPGFRAGLEAGAQVSRARACDAVQRLTEARDAFWAAMDGVDAILTLPVPDGAPLIGETTGFQDWLTPWTVFRGPLVSMPWGLDSLGRPRAVMLAAPPGAEATLLAMAAALEREAPHLPPPRLPDD